MEPREAGLPLHIIRKSYHNSGIVAEGGRQKEQWVIWSPGSGSKRLIKHRFDVLSMKTRGRKEMMGLVAQTVREEARCYPVTFPLAVQAEINTFV